MKSSWINLFLRLALGLSFLSAVADRFGLWPAEVSAWGNIDSFLSYTGTLAPWAPAAILPFLGWSVTVLETILGIGLILGIKVKLMAQVSGGLLLVFALSMSLTSGIKAPLDYSVFSAAMAAFALSLWHESTMALDSLWKNQQA